MRPAARAKVTVADPMAESAMAPRKPPWTRPAGLAKRSSARIRHTVRPGYGLVDTDHPQGQLAVGRDLDPLISHHVTLPPSQLVDTGAAWPIDATSRPGPAVLRRVRPTEDWTGDAVFYEYSAAADPVGAGGHRPGAGAPCSRPGSTPGAGPASSPSTSPARSASPTRPPARPAGLVRGDRPGSDRSSPAAGATSELTTASGGAATATWSGRPYPAARSPAPHRVGSPGRRPDPAGRVHHRARGRLLRPGGRPALPGDRRAAPPLPRGHRHRGTVRPHPVRRRPRPGRGWPRWNGTRGSRRSRVSVLLGSTVHAADAHRHPHPVGHVGVLPAGRVQRPHRHQSAALDLIADCRRAATPHRVPARRTAPSSIPNGWTGRRPAPSSPPPACGTAITTSRAGPRTWGPPGAGLQPSPVTRHPVRRRATTSALRQRPSEHPVAGQATGEVVGAVLESMGERPDFVTVFVPPGPTPVRWKTSCGPSKRSSIPW